MNRVREIPNAPRRVFHGNPPRFRAAPCAASARRAIEFGMRGAFRRKLRRTGEPVDRTRACCLVAAVFLSAYLSIVAAAIWIAVSQPA